MFEHFELKFMQGVRGASSTCSPRYTNSSDSGVVRGLNTNDAPKESVIVRINTLKVFLLQDKGF